MDDRRPIPPLHRRRLHAMRQTLWLILAGAMLPASAFADWSDQSLSQVFSGQHVAPLQVFLLWMQGALITLLLVAVFGLWRWVRRFRAMACVVIATVLPVVATAAQVTLPHIFANGMVADADEVNANFSLLENESNQQNLRLELVEDQIATLNVDGGDITGVSPGPGLLGGGLAGDVVLSADTSVLQARVGGGCPVGQSIRTITAAGDVVCELDDVGLLQVTADPRYVNATGDTMTGQLSLPGSTKFNTNGTAKIGSGLGLNNDAFGDALITGRSRAGDNWATFFIDENGGIGHTVRATGHIGIRLQAFPDALISGDAGPGDNWLLFFRDENNDIAMNVSQTGNVWAAGTGSFTTVEIRGGADISEPFDVGGPGHVEAGMVLSIDPERPGQLRLADSAYDRTVAGVVSGAGDVRPGMMLRQEGSIADGDVPVALTGRVYTWVDADANGSIQPGDLLTTSNTPGHAMKATDSTRRAGSVIGKAMTPLESGRGLVLALVSLQ